MNRPIDCALDKPCDSCGGDGYFVYLGGPGYFSESFGNWLPREELVACPACSGSGVALDLEVMADRYEELCALLQDEPLWQRPHDDADSDLPF